MRTEGGLALRVELRGLGSSADSKSQLYCIETCTQIEFQERRRVGKGNEHLSSKEC